MTDQELIDYYADLLILQYVGKPKAYAMIQSVVTPIIMDQLPLAVQNAFEIGTAVGAQLNFLGDYVGVMRSGIGINGQSITLSDADFTQLIRLGIIRNNYGSSLATIQDLLRQYFPNQVFVFDLRNMEMNYLISATIGSLNLLQMVLTQNLLPRPMGVELATITYLDNLSLFGFFSYTLPPSVYSAGTTYSLGNQVYDNATGIIYQSQANANLGNSLSDTDFWKIIIYPFNNYDSYNDTYQMLSYDDGIII